MLAEGGQEQGAGHVGTFPMKHALILGKSESSYPSGEVEKTQGTLLRWSKSSFWRSVFRKFSYSAVVSPDTILNSDHAIMIQAVSSHPEGKLGDELYVD